MQQKRFPHNYLDHEQPAHSQEAHANFWANDAVIDPLLINSLGCLEGEQQRAAITTYFTHHNSSRGWRMREKITSLTPNGLSLLTQMVSLHHGEKEGKVEGSSDDAASLHLLLSP